MLPLTKIKYSYVYCKEQYPHLSREEFIPIWERIKEEGLVFESLYEQHIKNILERIPAVSGFKWQEFSEKLIFIYIVQREGAVFSDPLTLKIMKNKKVMLLKLIHELCHHNMCFKFDSRLLQETIMDSVTLEVAKGLKLTFSEGDLAHFMEPYQRIFGDKYNIINLSDKTVKEYLKCLKK